MRFYLLFSLSNFVGLTLKNYVITISANLCENVYFIDKKILHNQFLRFLSCYTVTYSVEKLCNYNFGKFMWKYLFFIDMKILDNQFLRFLSCYTMTYSAERYIITKHHYIIMKSYFRELCYKNTVKHSVTTVSSRERLFYDAILLALLDNSMSTFLETYKGE